MITLIQFPTAWDVPNPSSFAVKAQVLLKLAGLPFEIETAMSTRKSPKGKLPVIVDDGKVVGDSEIIRWHLESKYGADFDKGLSDRDRAIAHAVCRMLEERTYWAIVYGRWIEDAGWAEARRAFFGGAPAPVRWLVAPAIRRGIRKALDLHGLGRHSAAEIYEMGARDMRSLAGVLGDKPFVMGAEPTGADATAFGTLTNVLRPPIASPMKDEALRHANLVDYEERMRSRFYP
ncbi:MAG: glutathione S-transferase family protein [Alphaproteobacteria bacterium]|nr:glutathione S-transferase family protein [Alphaproteobacteria bacterium]